MVTSTEVQLVFVTLSHNEDTQTACFNLCIASLMVSVVICGQNESDNTRLPDFCLVSHLPEALLKTLKQPISLGIIKSGLSLLEVYEVR